MKEETLDWKGRIEGELRKWLTRERNWKGRIDGKQSEGTKKEIRSGEGGRKGSMSRREEQRESRKERKWTT